MNKHFGKIAISIVTLLIAGGIYMLNAPQVRWTQLSRQKSDEK